MQKVLIFAGMGLVTYFTRYSMIAALGKEIPPTAQRWLRCVPIAVLTGLIVPAAIAPSGQLQLGPRAWAIACGTLVAWRTRSVLLTILVGMVAFWLSGLAGL